MAEDNLFSRVKNAIRGQKSSFCSRSTKVTILGYDNMVDPIIQYTNCDGVVSSFTYLEILGNGGYIDDCVQGGSPISVRNVPVKLFVQYGTTDCNTPPPGSNLIVISCNKQESFVINPSPFTLTKDEVYFLSFNDGVVNDGCYTIGVTTLQAPIDSLKNVSMLQPDCITCQNPA